MLNAKQPFVTEPHHFAWCARFTLTDAEIEEIDCRRRLGDLELNLERPVTCCRYG
jgi:hypothetical protein